VTQGRGYVRRLAPVVVLGSAIGLLVGYVATRWNDHAMTPGVLLTAGPSGKSDPYAVAIGAVTHGEAVLVDFGDGDFVFFVNRPEAVRSVVNGCGVRVVPRLDRHLPLLVEAHFRIDRVPPYVVELASSRYRFGAPDSMAAACDAPTTP